MLRPRLNRVWASTNAILRRDPGDAKYIQGWVSEIPTYQVLNFLQYKIDTTILALAERGIFEWGNDVQYQLGSLAWDSGTIYISTVGNPDKSKSPKNNPGQWAASSIQIPRADYDNLSAAVTAHIANKNNPHNVSAATIGAYTKDEINSIVAQYNALVKAHVDDRGNPHKTTAEDVGAVPKTGGTYTGPVTFNNNYVYFNANKDCFVWSDGKAIKLASGIGMIGISNNIPVGGTRTEESPIVLESTFKANKQLNEPKYAVPQPIFHVPLINNFCPAIGTVLSGNVLPTFSQYSGVLEQSNGLNVGKTMVDQRNFIDLSMVSGCVDINLTDKQVGTTNTSFLFGFRGKNGQGNGSYLFVLDNGEVKAERAVAPTWYIATTGSPIKLSGWHRLCFTISNKDVCIYCDGVLVGKHSENIPSYTGDSYPMFTFFGKSDPNAIRQYFIRNIRLWNVVLTPEQVSAL